MKPYNIVFPCYISFHPERGGLERVTDLLARELARRGHTIHYLHADNTLGYGDYKAPAQVHVIPMQGFAEAYQRFLEEHHIDFIINQGGLTTWEPLINIRRNSAGCPKIISVLHGNPLLSYHNLRRTLHQTASRGLPAFCRIAARLLLYPLHKKHYLRKRQRKLSFTARKSDCICLLTEQHQKALEEVGILPNAPCPIHAIANPCTFPTAETLPGKRRQLLYVGRLEPTQKATHRLIPIWKQLCHRHPDWELVIVGDGPGRCPMEKAAAGLPRIRFEGWQNPQSYYRDAAICCLTSTTEGLPMSMIEGMSFGAIPMAFDSFPALKEILGPQYTQLAAHPFSIRDYAKKLSRLMSDDALRRDLGQYYLEQSRQYSIGRTVDRWEELFASLS